MPKTKQTPSFSAHSFDHPPSRARMFSRWKKHLDALADFYGFESVEISMIDDPMFLRPLLRDNFLGERMPVLGKVRAGKEFFLRSSLLVSLLRAYSQESPSEVSLTKYRGQGDIFFLNEQRDPWITSLSEWSIMMFGETGPTAEAEVLQIVWKGLEKIGIGGERAVVRIHAVGCRECRPSFQSAFLNFVRSRTSRLCKACKGISRERPTELLRCIEEKCSVVMASSPQILDFLCDGCKKHFQGLLEFLDESRIPYFLDAKLFREHSLYNRIVFEITVDDSVEPRTDGEGASEEGSSESNPANAVVLAEGGRMSRASELLAKRDHLPLGAVVFFDRIEKVLRKSGAGVKKREPKIFLVQLGELAKRKSLNILESLRLGGIEVRESLGRDSIKSQFNTAERIGAKVMLVIGQKEALDRTVIVREVDSGIQETIPQEMLVEFLKKKLKK